MIPMVPRVSERVPIERTALLRFNNQRYEATIDDLSKNGLKVSAILTHSGVDILPDSIIDLEFAVPFGEVLSLTCKVRWSNNISPESLMVHLGVELTEAYPEYENYYKTTRINKIMLL